jgi:hypothetical protein
MFWTPANYTDAHWTPINFAVNANAPGAIGTVAAERAAEQDPEESLEEDVFRRPTAEP